MRRRSFLRRILRKRRERPCLRRKIAAVLAVILLLLMILYIRWQPVVSVYAQSSAEWTAKEVVNGAVAAVLEEKSALCRTLVQVHYTADDRLSGILMDTAAVNTVQAAVTAAIMERMDSMNSLRVDIPLGTLLGWDWISGWGPGVPFLMGVDAGVVSEVNSAWETVGINQSAYRVLIHVRVSLTVINPGGRSSGVVDMDFPVAETVIMGEVPGTLADLGKNIS